jgi:phage shock protein A
MGVFRRVSDIVAANLNDLVDRFEDPETMMKQAIREMEGSVSGAMDAAVRALANHKLLARELDGSRADASAWRRRAQQAIVDGDEDLARSAVGRALESDKLANALEHQVTQCSRLAEQMKAQVDGLHARLAEAKRKLRSLSLRVQSAEVLRRSRGGAGGLAAPSTLMRLAALEEKVARSEAEAEAWCQLAFAPCVRLDAMQDEERQEVDAELARLRARAE